MYNKYGEIMKKTKIITIVIFLIFIFVLSFNKKEEGTIEVNGDIVEYEAPVYVDKTSNLITKLGHYLSILVETAFEYTFVIINKIISFILGI